VLDAIDCELAAPRWEVEVAAWEKAPLTAAET
jgi:hypothetical protein